MTIPTSKDVIDFLAARGVEIRAEDLVVLPYVNPMWLANWNAAGVPEEDLREARWVFPQILE